MRCPRPSSRPMQNSSASQPTAAASTATIGTRTCSSEERALVAQLWLLGLAACALLAAGWWLVGASSPLRSRSTASRRCAVARRNAMRYCDPSISVEMVGASGRSVSISPNCSSRSQLNKDAIFRLYSLTHY